MLEFSLFRCTIGFLDFNEVSRGRCTVTSDSAPCSSASLDGGSLNSHPMRSDLPNFARSNLVELLALQKSARSSELIEMRASGVPIESNQQYST